MSKAFPFFQFQSIECHKLSKNQYTTLFKGTDTEFKTHNITRPIHLRNERNLSILFYEQLFCFNFCYWKKITWAQEKKTKWNKKNLKYLFILFLWKSYCLHSEEMRENVLKWRLMKSPIEKAYFYFIVDDIYEQSTCNFRERVRCENICIWHLEIGCYTLHNNQRNVPKPPLSCMNKFFIFSGFHFISAHFFRCLYPSSVFSLDVWYLAFVRSFYSSEGIQQFYFFSPLLTTAALSTRVFCIILNAFVFRHFSHALPLFFVFG